jgi:FkbH-like protein
MTGEELIDSIKQLCTSDAAADDALLRKLADCDDPGMLAEAGRLLAEVSADQLIVSGRTAGPLRVAVTGSFTTTMVARLVRACALAAGIAVTVHECPFDQTAVQLTDPDSDLARFDPEVTLCLLHDGALLPRDWDPTDLPALRAHVDAELDRFQAAVAGFAARASGTVLVHTVPLARTERDTVIGFRGKAALALLWREANIKLLKLPERSPTTYALDFESVLADTPGPVRDERLYRFAGMAWKPHVELAYAREAAKFLRAVAGRSRKCLVLDLDGTLWGGVVGDDGPAGIELGSLYPGNCYVDVQHRAAALRRQGVLLLVASKNEQAVVDAVFAEHPEMVLRAEDFAATAVDWQPKDANLRRLAAELDLGLDSFVFADDSAFECALVRGSLPQVETVHLTGDPSAHARRILEAGFFDTLDTTETDRGRTELYRARRIRKELAVTFASPEEFLEQLDLRVTVRPADAYSLPRVVQLGLRTNQFTMTGRAHSEAATRAMAHSPDHLVLAFEVADRLGREGVVGGVWITRGPRRWLIENFVMSCRVFSRGVERAVLQNVIDRALAAGATTLDAHFRPTTRNYPASLLYPDTGFVHQDDADGVVHYALPLAPRPDLAPPWIALEHENEPGHENPHQNEENHADVRDLG